MNRNIFPNFNDDFNLEEETSCPICDLVEAYSHQVTNASSHEEIEYILHGMVEGAFQDGFMTALQDDIEVKSNILDGLFQEL